jgi:hypothetical protein
MANLTSVIYAEEGINKADESHPGRHPVLTTKYDLQTLPMFPGLVCIPSGRLPGVFAMSGLG